MLRVRKYLVMPVLEEVDEEGVVVAEHEGASAPLVVFSRGQLEALLDEVEDKVNARNATLNGGPPHASD